MRMLLLKPLKTLLLFNEIIENDLYTEKCCPDAVHKPHQGRPKGSVRACDLGAPREGGTVGGCGEVCGPLRSPGWLGRVL